MSARISVGDTVRERDGRHLGIVTAIFRSNCPTQHLVGTANVRWCGTGFKSEVDLDDLVIVAKARTTTAGEHCTTVVPSPRFLLQQLLRRLT